MSQGGRTVIVCGGRAYPHRERLFATLDLAHAQDPIACVVTGDAVTKDPEHPKWRHRWRGADWYAFVWALSKGIWVEVYEADWGRGGLAGPQRNERMARHPGASICIAFPGGTGTADMLERARAHGIATAQVPV